jgi:hypothetical protein
MPNPRKGEGQGGFVARYMRSPHARKKFRKQSQRAAVAYSKYRSALD